MVAERYFKNEKTNPLLKGFVWLSFQLFCLLPAHPPKMSSEGILLMVGFKEERNFASVLLLCGT